MRSIAMIVLVLPVVTLSLTIISIVMTALCSFVQAVADTKTQAIHFAITVVNNLKARKNRAFYEVKMNTIKFEKKNTKIIAHRGLSGIEVENTNSAFVAAGNRSYYGIETDIYKTADGFFVIGHDDNYTRLCGEEIYLEKEALEKLESLVFFDKDGTKLRVDLRPSRLENYLSIVKKYEKHAVLELTMFEENSKLQHFWAVTMNMLLNSSGTQFSHVCNSTYLPVLQFIKMSLEFCCCCCCYCF